MRSRSGSPAGLGAPTVIVTFTTLCLVALALMTLSAARSDLALSEKTAAAVTAYYEAETEASEALAAFVRGAAPGDTADFAVPVDENRLLAVSAVMTEDGVEILSWRTVAVGDWDADDTLNVIR